ncbi:putative C6 transcription factor [Paecilomyces variotii]|uniref:Putative C6 transcription factor n=1 Tax=Byssochlamys spectabilis TaxID=264951 RepID=A0A443HK64_BYSSP|nr:putative C6 transcription factor [Paecilomyces variotii]KAJ9354300.1 transcriptional regulator family: Fungal Specific TF [Paecilomyces variotii]RWQ92179.1 putative C6 transcription factor [Paecilomyces variotii]
MLNPAVPPASTSPSGTKRLRASFDSSDNPPRSSSQSLLGPPRNDPGAQHHYSHGQAAHSPLTTTQSSAAMSSAHLAAGNSTSSFRNVSACNRCRLRKNRCDQRLPRCQSCEKAGVRCVGYDPITKREIPRSYVYFLEARVAYLEKVLTDNGIGYKEAAAFEGDETTGGEGVADTAQAHSVAEDSPMSGVSSATIKKEKDRDSSLIEGSGARKGGTDGEDGSASREKKTEERLDNLVSNIGMVSVQGTSDPRYLGSTSGISFARVVFAAVKSSVSGNGSDRGSTRSGDRLPQTVTGGGASTMRDSYFGLQTKPTVKCAEFPDRELANKLVELYFEHANPQMPILHRPDFVELMDRVYSSDAKDSSSRDLYVLNIVFAIGAGIIYEGKASNADDENKAGDRPSTEPSARRKHSSHQYQPEEYHAAASVHLEAFLSSPTSSNGFGAGLEELQAVLLLAGFALLRPVPPGLWYIVGVAVRLAVDLGLHYEDGTGIDSIGEEGVPRLAIGTDDKQKPSIDPRERGRREWVRDFRRRLWWCVYSFDRLVSTCVGRPFGITDQVITTEFPSLLDDKYITKAGFLTPPEDAPSYKVVAHHYLKLRLLQSEIQQVLQYQQARLARQGGKNSRNAFMHTKLPSPFLQNFDSFRSWRKDVHRRLAEWRDSAPTRQETGVQFSVEFFELNYFQAIVMLYRQSLTVPAPLVGALTPADDVSSPSFSNVEDSEDEDDIYLKVAEAGQKVLRIYRQLHRVHLVNYTYLATHHLFMAGISFLYAIWHSPVVRSRLTLDDVDFTVLSATSVLGDLMEKCPPAEACRDAFERMSKATVQMCLSTTGFGSDNSGTPLGAPASRTPQTYFESPGSRKSGSEYQMPPRQTQSRQARPQPRFDMNLGDLFAEGMTPPSGKRQRLQSYDGSGYGGRQPMANLQRENPQGRYHRNSQYMQSYDNTYDGPNPQQQQQQQQQQYYYNSPQSPSSRGAQQNYGQSQAPEQEGFVDPGLDFLDFAPGGAMNLETRQDGTQEYPSMPSFGAGAGPGLDLGFGLAVDFQHDWSEGTGYDLFDGFFFGGNGAGPSNGGN